MANSDYKFVFDNIWELQETINWRVEFIDLSDNLTYFIDRNEDYSSDDYDELCLYRGEMNGDNECLGRLGSIPDRKYEIKIYHPERQSVTIRKMVLREIIHNTHAAKTQGANTTIELSEDQYSLLMQCLS